MDIADLKNKRSELEILIIKEIKKFEEETDTSIISVDIERYQGGASRYGIVDGVSVEIRL